MEQIDFREFFLGVKDRLTLEQLRILNPYETFWRGFGVYLAMTMTAPKNAWVSWAVGSGLDFMHHIRTWARENKIEKVAFTTKLDNKAVNAIAKYWKAEKKGELNGNLIYEIDVFGVR